MEPLWTKILPEANGSDAHTSHPKGQGASNFQAAQDGYPSDRRDKTAATGPQSQTPGLECSHTHWLLELSVLGTLHQGIEPSSLLPWLFPGGSEVKASACNARDLGLIPGSGRSPVEGNGNPLQYSCLKNPMDGGAWWATVHGSQRVGHD